MRFNLKVPFAQKDAAKALGARWDATRKLWYVLDPKNLELFSDWMPQPESGGAPAQSGTAGTAIVPTPAPRSAAGVVTGPAQVREVCACRVLPWEHCSHTRPAS